MFDAYLKVFTLNSRFFDALLKVPLCLGLATLEVSQITSLTFPSCMGAFTEGHFTDFVNADLCLIIG